MQKAKNSAGTGEPGADRLLTGLHGLRGLAALMVMLFHLQVLIGLTPPAWLPWVGWHFSLGVHLFFVMSAFCLAWSNPRADAAPGAYFIKRLCRIGPLFWTMQIYYFWQSGWPGAAQLLLDVTFVFNLVPGMHQSAVMAGWAIGTEFVFYALFPLLLRLRTPRALALAVAATLAIGFAARRGLEAALPGSDYSLIAFIGNASFFMFGLLAFSLFARARHSPADGNVDAKITAKATTRVATAAALTAVATLGVLLSPLGARLAGPGNPDILAYGLAFGALCLWQALRPSRLLRSAPAQWLGERSYSIYLLHIPVILHLAPAYSFIRQASESASVVFLGCVAVTLPPLLLLAELGYRAVERPGMALGRRLLRARAP